ncbi:polyketide synthase [Actinomadura rubrobrunea]|uniref:Polyketide synthase n=2 Tax=Actinomadura rubrobrunea TaxID=115335 RepID=A0A9W6PVI4_9ACTN|nr:polyketide synthase [Actinomadura rubrobrunea]
MSLTNAEFDLRVRAVAATLRERVPAGERALILCPPGLDYVISFLACLYAKVIAVPAYPPDSVLFKRTLPRLLGVIEDARPAVVLATKAVVSIAGELAAHAPELGRLDWQAVDEVDPAAGHGWRRPDVTADDVAFLQYTSGSTARPKGVMVSHANLISNVRIIHDRVYGHSPDNHLVIWLPPYHDMGLIGGLLTPAFAGFPVTFMAPVAFLKRPFRWLKAISDVGANLTGAPNFAYDLCVQKISEEERATLDLSTLTTAFNGAEPVRAETIDRFSEVFAPCGFRKKAFYPCYGLAEATLMVSGGERAAEPITRRLEVSALEAGRAVAAGPGERARTNVGCGSGIPGHRVVVVDPERRTRLPEGRIGEIWVSGPSIAQGYWQRPRESEETFAARLADTGEGPFLRTGDLGFFDGTELFVAGRRKDVIIIEGRNHYPQDIERSIEQAHPMLRPGCGVACSREVDGVERLVVVHEVNGRPDPDEADRIIAAVRATVAEEHGLQVHDIALVRRGNVPKTSSGKLQRGACLKAFLDGDLQCLTTWSLSSEGRGATEPAEGAEPSRSERKAQIEERLRAEVAARLGTTPESVDPTLPLANYGLRSVDMVGIVGELERLLGRPLPATLTWEHPTIEALADFLSSAPEEPASTSEPSAVPVVATADRGGDVPPTEREAEPIAIVGIGCRFPGGADGPRSFWELLCEGRDAVTEVPSDRWNAEEFWDADPAAPGKTTTRWGGFLKDVDRFDPQFFGISATEAARMDPQQRLLAEVTWEALEDAGLVPERLAGSSTGVFIGISTNDYGRFQFEEFTRIDAYAGTGNSSSIAANRLSYLFDFRGPSMAVDTACSSSLVAVHQACASLARGDCSLAIAGGVNVILSPAIAINFSKAGAMAPDGRCKPFDARANGYVRSEGAGVVVLKPLGRALADRDPIYAVIRGGAVNQDGRSNGIMAPNPQAQEAVLRAAYADARVRPEQVHYVEAHGTGTLLGDPIEAKALAAVVGAGRDPAAPCLIGSVKSNLGHLEAAAGIAGLIKAALMVRHRMVPPSLHFERPNPHIPFDELALRVPVSLTPWPTDDAPALVGVSSFGFGGTNAHVVVQEAPRPTPSAEPAEPADGRAHLLTLSARDEQALRELAARYEAFLAEAGEEITPAALCAAAAVRRTHHEHRLACVGDSLAEFRDALAAFRDGAERPGLTWGGRRVGRHPKAAFLFSGQGPQWWPIAADLLDAEPVFREALERCEEILRPFVDWSLLDQLTGGSGDCRLQDPAVGQPALCAVQIALAALWRSYGVEPAAVVGHSVGEIAAAHVAGALSLADALRVALHRGRVIRSAIGKGRMALAGIPRERAERILADLGCESVWVAAANGPDSTVLSGETAALERTAAALQADGIFCRVLESVDYASHSPLMEPLAGEFRQLLFGLTASPATIPMISTVTGRAVEGTDLGAEYWVANLCRPVLFDTAVTGLVASGHDVFVEISPQPMLGAAVRDRLFAEQADGVVAASLRRDEPGRRSILAELGLLYCAGFPVDWGAVHGATPPAVAGLPSYPWQRQRYWIEDEYGHRRRRAAHTGHPALQTFVRAATEPKGHHWTAEIDLDGFPYLKDHRVAGTVVLPASFVLDASLAAARQALGDGGAVVEDVRLTRMAVVPETCEEATLQLVVVPEAGDTGSFRVFDRGASGADGWTEVAHGRLRAEAPAADDGAAAGLNAVRARCRTPVDPAEHYAALGRMGLEYGPAFQTVHEMWAGEHEAVARLGAPATADADPYLVHPALLDGCLQVLAAAVGVDAERAGPYLPVAVRRFAFSADSAVPRWAHAVVDGAGSGDEIEGRVVLFDEDGERVGEVGGITLRRLDGAGAPDPIADALFDLRWREAAEPDRADAADAAPGSWLLFADAGGVADRLAAGIAERGGACVTVRAGDGYRRLAADRYEIDPSSRDQLATLLADLRATMPACAGVVHAWSLDGGLREETDAEDAPRDTGCVSVLHLVQELAAGDRDAPPRLVMVTRGAQPAGGETAPPDPEQAQLWGLARVIMLEHRELRPLIIDLDPDGGGDEEPAALLDAVLRPRDEGQLALRGGRLLAPRLERWSAPAETDVEWPRRPFDPAVDENHRILATRPGILGSLTPTLWKRTPPGPGEVEIEVAAAGLNFNDVLKAMDICPGVPPGIVPLGGECAGTVVAVGDGVDTCAVGDRVMAVAPSSMAAYATTAAELVAPMPRGLSAEEAAATPIAFLTAVYGLEYLARLREGETVLIHSATGGVGLAALQVARRNGAEVYATAGTEEKRELLRSLGVRHVMDSRSLRFADEVRELTGGRGVDVVLNSLTGEALVRGVGLLAPGGRFVEIGKQDIYAGSNLGLGLLRHDRTFFAVDLERTLAERRPLIAELFAEVVRGFDSGDFTALPVTGFTYSEAPDAFAHMAQARHIGKVVLRPTGEETVAVRPGDAPVRSSGTYLITGGLGALGLETARYLVGEGARHLVLLGRRGPSDEARRTIAELADRGARIEVRNADVACPDDVAKVMKEIDAAMPPLAGVVHAAGLLDDGLLLQLDRDRFRSVAAPKVAGAWNLHRATVDRDLDFFVLFSSAAAVLGSPSQGNYAAANAFMDALAQLRRGRGLPAMSINWGPWSQIGLAATPDRGGALAAQGIVSLSPDQGVATLDRLLRAPTPQACVLPLDREKLRAAAADGLLPALLTDLVAPSPARASDAPSQGRIHRRLLAVEPGRRRRAVLVEHCRTVAAQVLKLDPSKIDETAPLASMGFDSLMALELRKRLETTLHVELPATIAWRFPTLEALVPFLAERMQIALEAEPAADASEPADDGVRPAAGHDGAPPDGAGLDGAELDGAELDDIPDSDIEALLLAKIQQIDEGR